MSGCPRSSSMTRVFTTLCSSKPSSRADTAVPRVAPFVGAAGVVEVREQLHDVRPCPRARSQPQAVLAHPLPVGEAVRADPVEEVLGADRLDHRLPSQLVHALILADQP
jgi:hypothetical protein